jgi:TRAP-type C4-dicarboxylate transport system substrate-binding protein
MKRLLLFLVVVLAISLLLGACGGASTTTTSTASVTTTSTKPATTTTTSAATTSKPTTTSVATTTTSPKAIKLTYSNFFPPTHLNSILAERWIKEVTTRTNGAVDIGYFPGGSLTAAAKVYDGVVTGISNIGMSVISYTSGRFPASELVEMPHGYTSGYVATMVANDFYNKFKPAELKDVHVLYFHAHGPGIVFTTKTPVRKLEDMKGLVLRSTGVGAKIATALGASGYAAAQNEALELMSKGVIQGSLSPREVLEGWKQAEVVKYVTGCYDIGYTANMYVVINQKDWDALPANVQKAMTDVSNEWIEKHAMVWTYYDQSAMDYFRTFPDREVITLPSDEMARWVEKVKPLVEQYLADLKGKNLPAAEYEAYLKERVIYWASKALTPEQCATWVKANLK